MAIGGFPEIISEDLGFSIESALRGYSGLYVNEPVCCEAVPETYSAFSRRQAKYCVGAFECLVKYHAIVLRGSCLLWWEKLDILLGITSNLVPALVVPFLFLLSVMIATSMLALIGAGDTGYGTRLLFLSTWAGRAGWSQLTTSFLYLLSALALCVPAITAMIAGRGTLGNRVRYLRWCTALYLGVMVNCFGQLARVIITSRTQFWVTGSRVGEFRGSRVLVIGLVMTAVLGVGTLNMYFAAIGIAGLVGRFHLLDGESPVSTWGRGVPVMLVTFTIVYLLVVVLGRAFFGFGL